MIITTKDLAPMGYCASGARRWFASHGLDWSTFVFEGYPEETLLATGDELAIALVKNAHERASEDENGR